MVSALWKACADGDNAKVDLLLQEEVDLEIKGELIVVDVVQGSFPADHTGVTPLIQAIKGGHLVIVKALLAKGADPANASAQGRPETYTTDPLVLHELAVARGEIVNYPDPNAQYYAYPPYTYPAYPEQWYPPLPQSEAADQTASGTPVDMPRIPCRCQNLIFFVWDFIDDFTGISPLAATVLLACTSTRLPITRLPLPTRRPPTPPRTRATIHQQDTITHRTLPHHPPLPQHTTAPTAKCSLPPLEAPQALSALNSCPSQSQSH